MGLEKRPPRAPEMNPWNVVDEEQDLVISPGAENVRADMEKYGVIGSMSDEELGDREAEAAEILKDLKRQASEAREQIIILSDRRDALMNRPHRQDEIDALNEKIVRWQEAESGFRREIDSIEGGA